MGAQYAHTQSYYATIHTASQSKACVCVCLFVCPLSLCVSSYGRTCDAAASKRTSLATASSSVELGSSVCVLVCMSDGVVSSVSRARSPHHGGNHPTYIAWRTCGVPAERRLIGHILYDECARSHWLRKFGWFVFYSRSNTYYVLHISEDDQAMQCNEANIEQ